MERLPDAQSSGSNLAEPTSAPQSGGLPKPVGRRELLAERILSLVGARMELDEQLASYKEFMPPAYLAVYEQSRSDDGIGGDLEEISTVISLRSSFELEMLGEGRIPGEFEKLLRELQLEYLKEQQEKMRQEITEAEVAGRTDEVAAKLKLFDDTSRRVQDIKNGKKG